MTPVMSAPEPLGLVELCCFYLQSYVGALVGSVYGVAWMLESLTQELVSVNSPQQAVSKLVYGNAHKQGTQIPAINVEDSAHTVSIDTNCLPGTSTTPLHAFLEEHTMPSVPEEVPALQAPLPNKPDFPAANVMLAQHTAQDTIPASAKLPYETPTKEHLITVVETIAPETPRHAAANPGQHAYPLPVEAPTSPVQTRELPPLNSHAVRGSFSSARESFEVAPEDMSPDLTPRLHNLVAMQEKLGVPKAFVTPSPASETHAAQPFVVTPSSQSESQLNTKARIAAGQDDYVPSSSATSMSTGQASTIDLASPKKKRRGVKALYKKIKRTFVRKDETGTHGLAGCAFP